MEISTQSYHVLPTVEITLSRAKVVVNGALNGRLLLSARETREEAVGSSPCTPGCPEGDKLAEGQVVRGWKRWWWLQEGAVLG